MKRFIIGLLILFFFTTYNLNDKFSLNTKTKIEIIYFENNSIINDKDLRKKLAFLSKNSLFFLKIDKVKEALKSFNLIESFEVKKIYPNKIKIKIFEKKPIFILQDKKNKFYYTDKDKIIKFKEIDQFKNLPVILGDKENFQIFYENLKNINFPVESIKNFHLCESGRWDLITNSNRVIKLPIENYQISLENFLDLNTKKSFEKFKVFDYRIYDQLILK